MLTVSGTFCSGPTTPSPRYSVATLVPLSATHAGVVGPCARPHGLTSEASMRSAPGRSETRLCCTKELSGLWLAWTGAAVVTAAATPTAATPNVRTNLLLIASPHSLGPAEP